MKHPRRSWMAAALSAGLLMSASSTWALDVVMSGFGTVGYAVSDKPYHYQRFIDDRGTFKRDSVLGGQADLKISSQWSATGQVMLAPSLRNDEDWSLTTSWAFLSWRPSNDWLLRLGKQRVPLYLNSENRDVGQTYNFARLPIEMYGLSPTTDLTGLYASRTWLPDLGEVTVDAFAGGADLTARSYARDGGALFSPAHTDVRGVSLTLKMETSTWRMSFHNARTKLRNGEGFPSHYSYVDPYAAYGPGLGFYDVAHAERANHIVNHVITLGSDVEVAPTWRVVSEFARNIQMRTENGANTAGGYIALLHKMERFTPYVSYARLRSMGSSVSSVNKLDAIALPGSLPGASDINMSQRYAADVVQMFDQDSVALGTSFDLTPQSKLKAEWLRTRIGNRSAMVDSPAGGDVIRREHINVLSLNYSFAY